MSTIWKYPLEITDEQIITMPRDAQVLCVQVQHDVPCIWALVNPENKEYSRKFLIFGTGHPAEVSGFVYVGTFQIHGGSLVFHVFQQAA